ncbi:MAG: hemolysin family protein [Bacteroidota bacterium]|jgi:CBS domain containing-hemolysin-like protein
MEFGQYVIDVLIILLFVFLNGFFVAAEFAIVKVRLTQIEPLAIKGNWHAKIARDILLHSTAYLSATQLGITMTSLVLGWIGEPLAAKMLLPTFQWIGITQPNIIHGVSFAAAFALITAVHIVVGEQAPKVLAIQKSSETILLISSPMRIFFFLFKPLITLLNVSSNGLLRLVRIKASTDSELAHTEEELRLILAHDTHVSTTTRNIALNAMDFHQKQARHSMVPRKEIIALSVQAPVKETITIMRTNKFSRFPVFKDTIDNIIGIVYTKDIFKQDKHLQPDFTLSSVLRDATFLPETATLERVLTTSLQKKTHMIILADEYGGTAGIITLENVLEELVGNIQDEFDRETPDVVKIAENEFVVAGYITTSDVERLFSIELSPLDIRSIGGFVIEQLGHIPAVGERMRLNGIEFTTEKVVDNAVESVRIKKLPISNEEETEH